MPRGGNRGVIFLFALAIAAAVAFAPLCVNAAQPVVREIVFAGNERTPDDTIFATIDTKVGSPLSLGTIDRDIRSLYRLGQFNDIKVDSVPARGGVRLTYIFDEKPIVAGIEFLGNRRIKDDDLRTYVAQRTYSPLDEKSIALSMGKIREAYAKKGYYLVDIKYHLDTTDDGETKLIFDVRENTRVAVRRVMFLGNRVFDDDELRREIRTRQKGAFSFLTGSGKYEEDKLDKDSMFLTYHYLNHGYLKVKVSPPRTTISKDKKYIFITFQIYEGKQYRIGRVDISGDVLTTRQELTGMLRTKSGDIYSQRTLDGDTVALTERYGDEGYAYATIVPQVIPDDEDLSADIDIRITRGNRITIERINIFGNKVTRDKVIRREMELKENDRYSERLLRRSKEKLMQLGYFEEVNFATPRGSADDRMVINITVKERPTGSFNIGAGFSSVEHFIFNASVQKENFFGYGIAGSLSTELSKRRQMFLLSVTDPYFLDSEWIAGFSVYRSSYLFNDFKRAATGGSLNLGHRFFDNFQADLGYQIEEVDVSSFNFNVPQVFRQNASGLTSAVSLSLSRDTRDNRIYPRKGTYNTVHQEVSGSKLGGDNDFYRVNFRSMFYHPIWKSIVFKQFFRIGYIRSLNESPVPLFERFFVGGPNSLRGFFPNSVGPRLRIPRSPSEPDSEFVYGGDKMFLSITELELPIYDPAGIRAVLFFDAGNAFAENESYSVAKSRTDYGFGLRWNSPMGPLRFEFGFPINRRFNEDKMVFNFTVGNYF